LSAKGAPDLFAFFIFIVVVIAFINLCFANRAAAKRKFYPPSLTPPTDKEKTAFIWGILVKQS